MASKALVLFQPNIKNILTYYNTSNAFYQPIISNQITYYNTSNVILNKNIQWININPKTYYSTANVYVEYYDTYRDSFSKAPYYPYIDFKGETYVKIKAIVENTNWSVFSTYVSSQPITSSGDWNVASTYVSSIAPITKTSDLWSAYSSVLSSYIINLGAFSTFEFDRVNSNIYKNIFSHLIFDVYSIQDKLITYPYKKLNSIFQMNHNFEIYDFVYIDKHGFYQKGIANSEETYAVIGMVYEIIDEDNFILMTNGIINNPFEFESDSGVIYLSDIEPGKCTTYENIHSMLYTPLGFHNDNKLIINILDSSIGDTLKLYQESFMSQNLARLSNQDINDIIQEVLDNS